ncbi:MAG: hypothetical protein R6U51_08385, partial [Anaerolineales bacterium]
MMITVSGKIKVDHLKKVKCRRNHHDYGQEPGSDHYEKKESIRRREQVNRLYFQEGNSKREIYRTQNVSWQFIIDWTQSPDQ